MKNVKRNWSEATFTNARENALVQLPDGKVGALKHISRNSRVAKVLVEGRYVRLPAADVKLIPPPPPKEKQ